MAIRLDEARLRMLKIVDTSNTIKIYPNNITSYTGLVVEGFQNGGYDGVHLGPNSNYMTVMSAETHQGLYNQSKGKWIIYYNRSNSTIGIGTSDNIAGYSTTISGATYIKGRLLVKGDGSSYNEGIRILPATNGWSNIFFSNDDTTSGNHAAGWLMGKRGAAGGVYGAVGDFTIEVNNSNGGTGMTLTQAGTLCNSGEIISRSANGFRIVQGNYGVFLRNDGSSTYFLITNSGDQYGTWGDLRPLYFSNTTGRVTMSNGASVGGYSNTTYTLSTASFICNSWVRTMGDSGWYSETHGGGWYMIDNTYVRSYNSKSIWAGNNIHIGTSAGNGTGLALYSTSAPTVYGIHMSTTANFGKHGDVQSDWATYFNMNAVGQRGWIYRAGSTNVASISANGVGTFKGVMGETGHILSPDGGRYTCATSQVTGYLKITLPVSWTNAMMRFTVDIYDYSTDNTVTYIIGGYNYGDTPQWYNMSAQCISKWGTSKSNLDVRFGHDGSKCAIYIGSANTTWSYPQVIVRDVLIGYYQDSNIATYSKGWSISFTTTLGTITTTKSNTNVGYSVNYANSAGTATYDSSGNTISSTYLKLAGGTMSANAAIKFPATAGSIATSDPMSITYGRIAAYGTLCLNADTDGTTTEYLILTAGRGHSSSTGDGLAVGYSTLTWQGNSVLTTAGGTLNNSAVLRRRYTSTSWVQGRAGAVLANSYDANNRFTSNAYNPLWSVKSINGSWDCGTYTANNNLYFTYITDANFDADNNSTTQQIYISGTTGRIHANLEGTAKYLGRSGDPAVPMVFNWSGQSGQPSWLWGGNDGTNMYVYNPSNFSVNYANSSAYASYLCNKSDVTYGWNGLQYFNASLGTTATATGNYAPTADWYHIIRMNHGNSNGYYVDIAACFHSNNLYMRRVASGTNSGFKHIWVEGNSITGAVWNDYAEYRESDCEESGRVLFENGNDTLSMTTQRLQPFAGVSSDTWGFCQGETEKAKTPIAVAGRVLVYTYQDRNNYKPGDCVCAAPGGTVDIMTREEIIQYPDRIVGTVSCVPEYLTWGSGDRDPVDVNGRIWIKV